MVTEAPERPASPRTVSEDPPPKRVRPPASLLGIVVKIVALAVLDAILLYAVFVLIGTSQWIIAAIAILAGLLLNYIYLAPKVLAGKYLAPGVAFLLIFQVFVIVYSAYIGFTNYGDGHDGTKEDAVTAIEQNSLTRVPNSPAYQVTPIAQGSTIALLITDPDGKTVSLGENGKPLTTVTNATLTNGQATGLPGWSTLSLQQQQADQDAITKIAVPISSDLAKGAIRTADGSSGYLYQPTLRYDAAKDEFTNLKTGRVYHDNGQGSFTAGDSSLSPGWTVTVGFQNFVSAFTEQGIAGPVVGVIIWTFVFAGLSTFLCFALGLFFAITFNHPTMRGKKAYRIIMILPYAFPSFLSALVWAGLLNQQFGFINSVLLGGAQVPWLSDPTLAKVSVLLVNLWMGFPYMFLVATGALQSIPDEVIEAGTVDGARPWAIFRLIKLPLLLVTMAPILIATFAFNFNNFNVIYLVTGGGPTDINAPINVGGSDILISLVYKIAFLGTNGRNYGLASAFSIIIFIIIATISIIAFRRTKSLEDVN